MPSPASNENHPGTPDLTPLEALDKSLEEIENTLRQMQLLAELSASDTHVDREWLQAILDRLRNKIDRIADQLE